MFSASVEHAGRIILASLFLFAGLLKVTDYEGVLSQMTEAGLSPSWLLLPPTIVLELGGGLVLAIGRWGAALTALVLAVFTLATNYFFHDFWTMEGEIAGREGALFLKNVAIAGALLFVSGTLWRRKAGTS
jgi:putative oxidoreductase